MERVKACGMPAVARWRTLPLERQLHWLLRFGVVGCFLGHGAYGLLAKEAWASYFGVVGGLEIVLAIAVLIAPLPSLLLGICLWKMGTETLFMTSGSLPFEWIERAGSYMAPLALYFLVVTNKRKKGGQSCAH